MTSPTHAVVNTPIAPVRAQPSVRAEQTSQELLGGVVEVLDRQDDWLFVRGEDGYEGWVNAGGLLLDLVGAEAWWDEVGGRPGLSLDLELEDDGGGPLTRLPWGARIAIKGDAVRLPDGRVGRICAGEWSAWEERGGARFPRAGKAVVSTARRWTGVPYVWGGRTRWGADCSGLVQMVYRTHGVVLPRDSHQQAEMGELVDDGSNIDSPRPGDLLFFRARNSERIVHVALSPGGSRILHAAEPNGFVRQDDLNGASELERSLAERLVSVRRHFP